LNHHLLRTQDFKEILNHELLDYKSEENTIIHKDQNASLLAEISLSKKPQNFKNYENKGDLLNTSKNTEILKTSIIDIQNKIDPFDRKETNFGYFMTSVDFKEGLLKKFPKRPQSSKVRNIKKPQNSPKKCIKSRKLLEIKAF